MFPLNRASLRPGATANAHETIEKSIRISNLEGRNWRSELFFLIPDELPKYPTFLHSCELRSLMVNRHIRTEIPYLDISRPSKLLQSARSKNNLRKSKVKERSDKRHKATTSDIRRAIKCCCFRSAQTSWPTKYDPKPFIISRRKGVSVELARGEA